MIFVEGKKELELSDVLVNKSLETYSEPVKLTTDSELGCIKGFMDRIVA